MDWQIAPDLDKRIKSIIRDLGFSHIDTKRVFCFRSNGSRSRAQARIWGFARIWQKALGVAPSYCLEVISEKFDRLSADDQNRVLIHELLHIPKNFSGALLSHRRPGYRIDQRTVEGWFIKLK